MGIIDVFEQILAPSRRASKSAKPRRPHSGQRVGPSYQFTRSHKGAQFRFAKSYTTRREARAFVARSKIHRDYHYRIYRLKHHGYRVYIGPPKTRHGGVRQR